MIFQELLNVKHSFVGVIQNLYINDQYLVCYKLSEYGCNPILVDPDVIAFANSRIDFNYTISNDPCSYEQIDGDELARTLFPEYEQGLTLSQDAVFIYAIYASEIPCQLLLHSQDLLVDVEKDYLLDYSYWFGDNGQCDIINPENHYHAVAVFPCDNTCTLSLDTSVSKGIYYQETDWSSSMFGFHIITNMTANLTITIRLMAFKYQCSMRTSTGNGYYVCDIHDKYLSKECIVNETESNYSHSNVIQIDLEKNTSMELHDIFITVSNGRNSYQKYIDTFCLIQQPNGICQDSLYIAGSNASVMIEFGPETINIGNVSLINSSSTCNLCVNDIITKHYGFQSPARNVHVNQGKVNGISSWGIRSKFEAENTINTLWDLSWTSDGNNTCIQYLDRPTTTCQSFSLQGDDYIHGYRVIYDDEYIYGLTFYTNNNLSYNCTPTNIDTETASYQDSGPIIYENYYLSGFVIHTGYYMNGIIFVFSPLSASDYLKCEETYQYLYVPKRETPEDANKYCNDQYNTFLATINSESDWFTAGYLHNSWIYGQEPVWIGLTDKINESHWQWIDAATACKDKESKLCYDDLWNPGQPDGQGNEDYGFICYDGSGICDGKEVHEYMFMCNNPKYPGVVFEPTWAPTLEPTPGPTNVLAIKVKTETIPLWVWPLIGASVFMVISISICVYCKRRRRKMKEAKLTILMKQPMVVVIAIGFYDKSSNNEFILRDLHGIDQDIRNAHQLFCKTLKHKMYPEYNMDGIIKQYWQLMELKQFLDKRAKELDANLNKYKEGHSQRYDGLVVIISCHGIKDYILTSDCKKFEKAAIHRIFSAQRPEVRKIPRMFIFDCCAGSAERDTEFRGHVSDEEQESSSEAIEEENQDQGITLGKNASVDMDIGKQGSITLANVQAGDEDNQWLYDEANPDFKLITIFAANQGFQSKMNSQTGSYVITSFTEAMIENIEERDNKRFLFQIFDDIQNQLHASGKQLCTNTFNNNTRYIKFVKNQMNAEGYDEDAKQVEEMKDIIEDEIAVVNSDDKGIDNAKQEESESKTDQNLMIIEMGKMRSTAL